MTKTNAACAKKNNRRDELNKRPFFLPCEYSNEDSAVLCKLGCGFWPPQCQQCQEAGSALIAQMRPKGEAPKDISRPSVAGAPWQCLVLITLKFHFSGGSPSHARILRSAGIRGAEVQDLELNCPKRWGKERKLIGLFWDPNRVQLSSGISLSQLTSI